MKIPKKSGYKPGQTGAVQWRMADCRAAWWRRPRTDAPQGFDVPGHSEARLDLQPRPAREQRVGPLVRRQITAVRMSGGETLPHIAGCAYVYSNADAFQADALPVASIITDIQLKTHAYFMRDWKGEVADVTVAVQGGRPYLRTKPDGIVLDNLLRLPHYGGTKS